MNRFAIASAISAASAFASPALAATVASTQFGISGPRIADPVSVDETFGAFGDPARGRGRADAASLGVRLEVDPFNAGIVDAAVFEQLFFLIPVGRPSIAPPQPASVALSGRLTGTIEEIDPATGLPRPAGQSTGGNLQIGVAPFRSEAERAAARQRQAAGPDDFSTDLTGAIGGGAGVTFGVTPATSPVFTPMPTAEVCDAVCQDFIRNNPVTSGVASPGAASGVFSLGFTLVASSDGDSLGAATLDALASLEIDGLILLDAAGDPVPAFIVSETRDYTVAAFAPGVASIPLPAAAPLFVAGLAALGLLRRARRG